jgi:uncharacterized protein YciI
VAQYLYQFLPGDRPDLTSDPQAWTSADEAIGERHYRRLRAATDEGVVVLAGRSQDGIGPAVVIFEADSDEAAVEFMNADPFVAEGLFTASLHPFRAALVRNP